MIILHWLLRLLPLTFLWMASICDAKNKNQFRVVGYYSGSDIAPAQFETEKLTHLIFCFCHLAGNRLQINSERDSAIITEMVELKKKQPGLKIMLSLGGWGGCETCSTVFQTEAGRKAFARSVKEISDHFHTDGIDLDWEYPSIKGYPGHAFHPNDKQNFTALVKALREANNKTFEISFAAGGFTQYIQSSVEWRKLVPLIDFVNVMSYDLVHGYSTTSGHHTPLYSTPAQVESTDHAVKLLLQKGVPAHKIVIGAAFYGRFFAITPGSKVDLYSPCIFSHSFSSKDAADTLAEQKGFIHYWDDVAKAPYALHPKRRLLATYDDERSIALKTRYANQKHLGGIMFWQLFDDKRQKGLLDIISQNH